VDSWTLNLRRICSCTLGGKKGHPNWANRMNFCPTAKTSWRATGPPDGGRAGCGDFSGPNNAISKSETAFVKSALATVGPSSRSPSPGTFGKSKYGSPAEWQISEMAPNQSIVREARPVKNRGVWSERPYDPAERLVDDIPRWHIRREVKIQHSSGKSACSSLDNLFPRTDIVRRPHSDEILEQHVKCSRDLADRRLIIINNQNLKFGHIPTLSHFARPAAL